MSRSKPEKFASNHVGGRLHGMCAAFVRDRFPDIYQQFKDHIYAELGLTRKRGGVSAKAVAEALRKHETRQAS